MKKFALIALALASLCVPASAEVHVLCGKRLCVWFATAEVPVPTGPPNAKIITASSDTQETEAGWALRCEAKLVKGEGIAPDRWSIANPACR